MHCLSFFPRPPPFTATRSLFIVSWQFSNAARYVEYSRKATQWRRDYGKRKKKRREKPSGKRGSWQYCTKIQNTDKARVLDAIVISQSRCAIIRLLSIVYEERKRITVAISIAMHIFRCLCHIDGTTDFMIRE